VQCSYPFILFYLFSQQVSSKVVEKKHANLPYPASSICTLQYTLLLLRQQLLPFLPAVTKVFLSLAPRPSFGPLLLLQRSSYPAQSVDLSVNSTKEKERRGAKWNDLNVYYSSKPLFPYT
jgi:hypothetical protein